MTYPSLPRATTADVYVEREIRSRSHAARLTRDLHALRTMYASNPRAREALPLAELRERHALAVGRLGVAQRTVEGIAAQRPTPVRTARLHWRRAELEIAELQAGIAALKLERVAALSVPVAPVSEAA